MKVVFCSSTRRIRRHSRVVGFLLLACIAGTSLGCPDGSSSSDSTNPPASKYQFVYATNEADNTVTAYRTNSDGTLQLIGVAPTGRMPGGIVSTNNDYNSQAESGMVFVLNRADNTISQYVVQDALFLHSPLPGLLTPTTVPTVATGKNPIAITYDARSALVYVACAGDNTVTTYNINQNGAEYSAASTLVRQGSLTTGSMPDDMSGGIITNSGDLSVSIFVSPGGNLQGPITADTPPVLPTSSVPSRVWATDFQSATPFYVISTTNNTIQAFNTEDLGGFTSTIVSAPAIATGRGPSSVTADSQNSVFVANFADNTISQYGSDRSVVAGAQLLTPLTKYGTGSGPYDLILSAFPNVYNMYCLNRTDQTIEVFKMAYGGKPAALTAVSTVPTGKSPNRLAIFVGNNNFAPQTTGSISVPIRSSKKR